LRLHGLVSPGPVSNGVVDFGPVQPCVGPADEHSQACLHRVLGVCRGVLDQHCGVLVPDRQQFVAQIVGAVEVPIEARSRHLQTLRELFHAQAIHGVCF